MHKIVKQILENSKIPVYKTAAEFSQVYKVKPPKCAGCYTHPVLGTTKEGIYLNRKYVDNFVVFHELAHATGPRLGRTGFIAPSEHEECVANAVAVKLLEMFGLDYNANHEHLQSCPPSKANRIDVDTAYWYILANWCSFEYNKPEVAA